MTLRVVGEVSQVKKHSSGHIYFTLKDKESSLSAICWRSNVNKLNVKIEEGSSVVIIGRVTTYSPQSKSTNCGTGGVPGEGLLLKVLEDRKRCFQRRDFLMKIKKKIIHFPIIWCYYI